jgi:hypothetical protein
MNPSTLPGIECLTALEDLEMVNCGLEPSCLLLLPTSLTRLHLEDAALQPSNSTVAASQLLQALARLPALSFLGLRYVEGWWPEQLSAYSALTASSNLQFLVACGCDMPGAAWAHVFPVGRQLPHLHTFDARADEEGGGEAELAPFDSTGIAHLVSCCPALEFLAVFTSPTASLTPLRSLTALTQLEAGSVSHAAIKPDLVALSQLQQLSFEVTVPVGRAQQWRQHLVPLTALTNLTSLSCSLVFDSHEDDDFPDHSFVSVVNEVGAQPQCVGPAVLRRCMPAACGLPC